MKRTVIGLAFMLIAVLTKVSIFDVAARVTPELMQWSTASDKFGAMISNTPFLMLPFIFSSVLFFIGLVIVMIEYFKP